MKKSLFPGLVPLSLSGDDICARLSQNRSRLSRISGLRSVGKTEPENCHREPEMAILWLVLRLETGVRYVMLVLRVNPDWGKTCPV